MYTYITEQCSVFLSKKVRKTMSVFFTLIIVGLQVISAQGRIVLEKKAPSETVVVTATQQVILKPGFRATAANGSFNAKIGQNNSLLPTNLYIAEGSTALIANIFVPGKGQNYIKTTTYLKNDQSESIVTYQYFDGFGRPIQTVQKGITPSCSDLITSVEYDNVGREYKKWLPVAIAGNAGDYVDINTVSSTAQTMYADSRPFSEIKYEPSPLNRAEEKIGAGQLWETNNKSTKTNYETNEGAIAYFYVNSSDQLCKGSDYDAGTLFVTKVTDEDSKFATEYKDKLGQVIMKQSSTDVYTYYVYNDLGLLSYVLPPGFVDGIGAGTSFDDTNTLLKQYAYVYRYDDRGNCIYKKLPACDPVYMVYDRADRLVLSQDGNQRNNTPEKWTGTYYDSFGRVVVTQEIKADISDFDRSEISNNQLWVHDYTSAPNLENGYCGYYTGSAETTKFLVINYYDNYDFLNKLPADVKTALNFIEKNDYGIQHSSAKGLLTGSRSYLLDGSGNYSTTALYYDVSGQVVQTRATNHLGGYDLVYNQYDFTGKIVKTLKTHGVSGASDTYKELYAYTYDNGQRLTATALSLNGATPVTLANNAYDEPGRLKTKTLGNGVDATTYNYNIRGHITEISGSKFSENLYYNTNTANLPNFTPCYNGNISGMKWNVANEGLGYQRAYSFDYDNLNRLTNSVYSGNNGSGVVSGTLGKFNESLNYQNDKMGNIHGINRFENGVEVENLSLSYLGNQLTKVDNDKSHFVAYGSELFRDYDNHIVIPKEYAYDANGNMLFDANGGVSAIQYNIVNLPNLIQFTEGHRNQYTYNASGQKLRVVNYSCNRILDIPMGTISPLSSTPSDYTVLTTDYVGNMIYENGTLKQIVLPDGYYQNGTYYYYLKDHLGNNRVTINSSGAVVEKSHYYPSGTRFFTESTSNSTAIPYRYNGKEMETMNGLNQMDYGARRRFAGLPIWTGRDPKSELLESVSPYVYALNSPTMYVDKDGELPILINGKVGDDSERANRKYWEAEILNTISNSGIPNPHSNTDNEFHFVDGDRYYSFSSGSIGEGTLSNQGNSSSSRIMAGYNSLSLSEFERILSKLEVNSQGKIVEKIQIYTHSRGAAFGVGYTERLLELIEKYKDRFADPSNEVDFVFNMAPHQSNSLIAPEGVDSYSIDRTKDALSGNDMQGLKAAFTTNEGGFKGAHKIATFTKDLKAFSRAYLKGGTSQSIIDEFIMTMKDRYNIDVTVK